LGNKSGDVILLHDSNLTFPGKKEIILSRHFKGVRSAVQKVLMKVDKSRVRDSVKDRFNIN
jgi:hypothetical protein